MARTRRPVPPPSSQRLEQRRGVAQPRGLRLCQRQRGLVVSLFGVEQRQPVHIAPSELPADQFHRDAAGSLQFHCRGQHVEGQGSGLGLAIVRDIVALHGATVTLTRSASGGACVTIRFSG